MKNEIQITNSSKNISLLGFIVLLNILLLFANLFWGSVNISANKILDLVFNGTSEIPDIEEIIIIQSRLPQALTALLTGAALSVAGLLMQTLFRNPLAGPGILGISSGASIGVAIISLIGGSVGIHLFSSLFQELSMLMAAFVGAFLFLGIILVFANFIRSNISLLIIGLMLGYTASSLIGFLQFISHEQQLHSFVIWGLGSFSNVSLEQLKIYSIIIVIGVSLSFLFVKPLNLLLLGENYAANLGLSIKRLRFLIILITGILTATATAYAGPIAFIGLAVPHLARLIFKTTDHKIILPGIVLTGMGIALVCNLISRLPAMEQALPINTVTSLFGAPLVIWFLIKNNRIYYKT